MARSYISPLTKPNPVYNPKKGVAGLPAQRRRSSVKQQIANTIPDSTMKRRDLDFIATLWVVEEKKCDCSSDESEQEVDAARNPATSDVKTNDDNAFLPK